MNVPRALRSYPGKGKSSMSLLAGYPLNTTAATGALQVLDALPHPIFTVNERDIIEIANPAAEVFFGTSLTARHQGLDALLPVGSSLMGLIAQIRQEGGAINEHRVDLGLPRLGLERPVDIFVAPLAPQSSTVVVMLRERSIAEKLDRQHMLRGSARSVSAMASMLAHEIKNPLSGIRGAAQLLETEASDGDRALTRLICDETDRIVKLVDRMKPFSAGSNEDKLESVNIHAVLDHVKKVSQAGFARHIAFKESYDPSLPPVLGDRDQLIQVFLNLAKNSAEAIGSRRSDGEIEFKTSFRPGVRLKINGQETPLRLPLEFCVSDNGPGIAPAILPRLFDPFVTTKPTGTGLGLALIAKIVGDHGGIVECESHGGRTTFKILMPMHMPRDGRSTEPDV